VKSEIDVMARCYEELSILDRPAQIRALWWLEDRLTAEAARAEPSHSSAAAAPRTESKA
jgi:hypothetical protein